jgi:hypothetical protein
MDNTFMPKDYEVPVSTGLYMKLEDGSNKFLPLGSIVYGYEYWNTETKPVRSREAFKKTPADIKLDDKGKPTKVKHFWAFPVWNYNSKQVQLLQLTQKSVIDAIVSYVKSEDWGNPVLSYSFTVDKKGKGFETNYTVMANPKKDIPAEITEAWEAEKDNMNVEEIMFPTKSGDPVDDF